MTKVLLNRELDRQIETPLLLCQAARDTVVRLPEQNEFVSLLPHAQLRAFDAKHEIYMSDDTVMREYVPAVIGFFEGMTAAVRCAPLRGRRGLLPNRKITCSKELPP